MERDNSESMVKAAAEKTKAAIGLKPDGQETPWSGHSSGPSGGGPDQKAAVPSGSPGTGYGS